MERVSWLYRLEKFGDEYDKELDGFMEAAKANAWNNLTTRICYPCKECKNLLMWDNPKFIRQHLVFKGFMVNYTCWKKHSEITRGEPPSSLMIWWWMVFIGRRQKSAMMLEGR